LISWGKNNFFMHVEMSALPCLKTDDGFDQT
jgi:hypothetical protein